MWSMRFVVSLLNLLSKLVRVRMPRGLSILSARPANIVVESIRVEFSHCSIAVLLSSSSTTTRAASPSSAISRQTTVTHTQIMILERHTEKKERTYAFTFFILYL